MVLQKQEPTDIVDIVSLTFDDNYKYFLLKSTQSRIIYYSFTMNGSVYVLLTVDEGRFNHHQYKTFLLRTPETKH